MELSSKWADDQKVALERMVRAALEPACLVTLPL